MRLPTTHDHRDRTQVWLKMPDDGVIETRWLDDHERWTISLPPGSRIDRVESLWYQRDDGQRDGTVVDVRGAHLSDEPASVHVCRPTSGQPRVPLVGYSWPRAHPEAQRHATALLVDMLHQTRVPIDQPPMSGEALDRFVANNECGRCHRPDLPTHTEDRNGLPHRTTDADGCYVPLTVLQAASPPPRPTRLPRHAARAAATRPSPTTAHRGGPSRTWTRRPSALGRDAIPPTVEDAATTASDLFGTPCARLDAMTKTRTRAVAHPPASVLVAEDDVWFCETIAWALENSGYVAHRASSASEALELAASGAQIDLLLTDVVMPGMGGVELADQIHAQRPDLPVIFMSGYAESELHEHGLLPPEAPSLQKPFRLEELAARIEDTVHPHRSAPGAES